MHLAQKLGIVRRIPCSRWENAHRASQCTVDAIVQDGDPGRRSARVAFRAERESEHRADCAVGTAYVARQVPVEPAVWGHRRVRELEENGAAPSEQHHQLPVDLMRYTDRRDRARVGARARRPLSDFALRQAPQPQDERVERGRSRLMTDCNPRPARHRPHDRRRVAAGDPDERLRDGAGPARRLGRHSYRRDSASTGGAKEAPEGDELAVPITPTISRSVFTRTDPAENGCPCW